MKQIIKYILVLLFPVSLIGQDSLPVLTLDTILARIAGNNISLQAYELEAESYKHRADASTAWMAPMVGVGTFMTPYPFEKVMEARDRGNIMVQLEQSIPNAAKNRAKKNYILSQKDAVLEGKNIQFNELRATAKQAYYNWLVAKRKIGVLNEAERLLSTMKKVEEVRYPYNRSQLSGNYIIEAKIEQNKNMVVMQQGIIARSRAALLGMMNENIRKSFDIDSLVDDHFVPPPIEDTGQIASVRSDIHQMNQRINSMQMNIRSLRHERKPDFKIRLDHMSPLSKMMPNAFNVMAMVSVPIVPWASRMYKSEIKAMEFSIRSMEKQRSGMLQETRGMINAMQVEIESMHERVISIENKVIPALQKALQANYLAYQENKMELNEVLDSWEALNMMQIDLLDEKLKHYQMIVEYEKQLFQ